MQKDAKMLVLWLAVPMLVLAMPTWAGSQAGLRAYQRGDHATAFRELRPLAEQGHADAQYRLGVLYDYGKEVPRDHAQALKWLRRAAEQGHAGAQHQLGLMLCMGYGLPQDHERAYMWFQLAAGQLAGEERKKAIAARDSVVPRLTPEQVARAQKMAREWQPKPERE